MRRTIGLATALLALGAVAAAPGRAQRDTGSGSDPNYSAGAVWQSEITLAREALLAMQTELDALEVEEWKERSVAWIEVAAAAEGTEEYLTVPASWHVGGLDAGKKVEVELESEYDPEPRWQVRYGKKPPRSLTLVLTDDQGTRVECSLADLMKQGPSGYLGVFVHEESSTVHCLPRAAAG